MFDTVASLANPKASIFFLIVAALLLLIPAGILSLFGLPFLWSALALLGAAALIGLVELLRTHIKTAFGFDGGRFWQLPGYSARQLVHCTELRMKFYDRTLNTNVEYARHVISIDENRASFQRVAIDPPVSWPDRKRERGNWLTQLWFAGDHSDIGGSHPENKSRLSDIALWWMASEAETCGLLTDRRVLQLSPSCDGMQHDEYKSSIFKHFGKLARDPYHDLPLHHTVAGRFELAEVLNYDVRQRYRPECLRKNQFVAYFWDADDLIAQFKDAAYEEAMRRVAASLNKPYEGHEAPYWQAVANEITRRS